MGIICHSTAITHKRKNKMNEQGSNYLDSTVKEMIDLEQISLGRQENLS